MKIIITGGTGLIGRALSSVLWEAGHEVIVLTRSSRGGSGLTGVKMLRWDGMTARGWGAEVEGADAIVNLAGESLAAGRWTAERKEAILTSRLMAGKAVLEAVQQATVKPGVVIQASGIGCYGLTGEQVVDEAAPYGDDFLSGVAKAWEASTWAVEHFGVRRVVLRTGIVLSVQGGALQPLLLTTRFFAGGSLGTGRQWWPWIHIQDEVRAIMFLIQNQQTAGAYNLVAPNPVQMSEFGRTLANVMGRPYWLPAPGFAIKTLLGEMSTLILDGQRAVPNRLVEAGFEFKFRKLHSALVNLLTPANQIKLE